MQNEKKNKMEVTRNFKTISNKLKADKSVDLLKYYGKFFPRRNNNNNNKK